MKESKKQSKLQNALLSKQNQQGNSNKLITKDCFKYGQKGDIKNNCRNKPHAKYIEYRGKKMIHATNVIT